MASVAKGRPSRRSVPRRSYAIEDTSESEDPGNVTPTPDTHDDDDGVEEDYTPVPKKARRASSKRMTLDPVTPSTVRPASKAQEATTDDSDAMDTDAVDTDAMDTDAMDIDEENDENDEGVSMASMEADPISPSSKAALKRKSMAHPRKSHGSITPRPAQGSLPTPEPSQSPEPQERAHRTSVPPLSDITESAVNQSPSKQLEEPKSQISIINPNSTVLERPMDIVAKSRTQAPQAPEEPAAPKPRMIIENLILTNFKSYAGQQIVGPFHASFSSVVGPNGSGKSNVIDSLLFVFGFRASKMRQGKISALIHNSAQYPNLAYCEVEVHFSQVLDLPEGGQQVVPDSQLIVSRRA